ncbi:DUF2111 domain-containing protein [Methanobacterium petrolearium]|uniref:DUF2111 domain-containing protein n=1 Tax=Methanobacterium petrolearium TaxID=710190 RepID=UPI001AEAD21D|nr:DUF2111 domain-containing protein [Methanobacterium petrolearium]MBP1945634.1 hypothetical protein [Methanobacterium petrolearium]BDZ71867.1 hypothetical protein GCM10025861_23840 [Methanobacterium petrolearium]
MNINASSTGEEIATIAIAIHQLVNGLPFTMRTSNNPGVRIEEGKVLDYNYTGPILEEVIKTGKQIQIIPKKGAYQGTPVVVVPIIEEGQTIAAMGVVDITKGIYSDIIEITKRPEELNDSRGGLK